MNASVFGLGNVAGVDASTEILHVSSLPGDTVKCQVAHAAGGAIAASGAIQEGPVWADS
jgi:hypothetical protein